MNACIPSAELSKTALARHARNERIAAANIWRGQCLDNFARIEHAIIGCLERLGAAGLSQIFVIAEQAGNRTRKLRDGLRSHWSTEPQARHLAVLLDRWSIREKERNKLVHGRFTIKAGASDDNWLLINELLMVKTVLCLPAAKAWTLVRPTRFFKR